MIYCVESFGLPLFRVNVGIHWRDSVLWPSRFPGADSSRARRAPDTADTSNFHGKAVDTDATVLGSGPAIAPGRFRSLAGTPHPVSISPISATIPLLI